MGVPSRASWCGCCAQGHHDVKLSAEELDRIITWVDLNAPYYPTYNCAYPESVSGRCPLTRPQLARLCELVGPPFNWGDEGSPFNSFGSSPGIMVSFDRPELSPCLAVFKDKADPRYVEALALIQAGKRCWRRARGRPARLCAVCRRPAARGEVCRAPPGRAAQPRGDPHRHKGVRSKAAAEPGTAKPGPAQKGPVPATGGSF